MKYAFIRALQAEFGVRAMCRVLRVHFSGFYAWLKEPLSPRAQDDARQTELIRQAWSESGKVYGYRKLADDLRKGIRHKPVNALLEFFDSKKDTMGEIRFGFCHVFSVTQDKLDAANEDARSVKVEMAVENVMLRAPR